MRRVHREDRAEHLRDGPVDGRAAAHRRPLPRHGPSVLHPPARDGPAARADRTAAVRAGVRPVSVRRPDDRQLPGLPDRQRGRRLRGLRAPQQRRRTARRALGAGAGLAGDHPRGHHPGAAHGGVPRAADLLLRRAPRTLAAARRPAGARVAGPSAAGDTGDGARRLGHRGALPRDAGADPLPVGGGHAGRHVQHLVVRGPARRAHRGRRRALAGRQRHGARVLPRLRQRLPLGSAGPRAADGARRPLCAARGQHQQRVLRPGGREVLHQPQPPDLVGGPAGGGAEGSRALLSGADRTGVPAHRLQHRRPHRGDRATADRAVEPAGRGAGGARSGRCREPAADHRDGPGPGGRDHRAVPAHLRAGRLQPGPQRRERRRGPRPAGGRGPGAARAGRLARHRGPAAPGAGAAGLRRPAAHRRRRRGDGRGRGPGAGRRTAREDHPVRPAPAAAGGPGGAARTEVAA